MRLCRTATGVPQKSTCWASFRSRLRGFYEHFLYPECRAVPWRLQDGLVGGLQARNVSSALATLRHRASQDKPRWQCKHVQACASCDCSCVGSHVTAKGIAATFKSMGFNCVRFPWSVWMVRNPELRFRRLCARAHLGLCSCLLVFASWQVQTNPRVPDHLQKSLLGANPQLMGLRALEVLDAAARHTYLHHPAPKL